MRIDRRIFTLAFFAYLLAVGPAWPQEHPEHPKREHPQKEKSKKEHPEHPKEHPKAEAAKAFTTADLEQAIKANIAARERRGFFRIKDPVSRKTWRLKLDRVHTDKLTQLDPDTYFACVDFIASDGKRVDVDFFLKREEGKLVMTDTTIHKVNGVPRYNWQEQDGFWKRVPIQG